MTELETAVEWLRDMRRVAGPHCEYATTLLDTLDETVLIGRIVEATRTDDLAEAAAEVERLAGYCETVEARLEGAGVLDPDRRATDLYDVDGLLAMFLPDANA